jgi:hypothetical protein
MAGQLLGSPAPIVDRPVRAGDDHRNRMLRSDRRSLRCSCHEASTASMGEQGPARTGWCLTANPQGKMHLGGRHHTASGLNDMVRRSPITALRRPAP